MGNETSEPQRPSGSSGEPRKEYTFKVVVIGDKSTGKTALINRVVHGLFTGKEKPTQGVEFALRTIHGFSSPVTGDRSAVRHDDVRLVLWDVGAGEKFGGKTRFYYEHAVAGIVVADASKPKSLQEAEAWVADLRAKATNKGPNGEALSIPVILFLNKVDLITPKQLSALAPTLKAFARTNDLIGFWTCSAKEDTNFDRPMHTLVARLLEQLHSDEVKQERSTGYSASNLQPLELATHCAACQAEFSIFTWKHHCRKCGLVYCGLCTPHTVMVRGKDGKGMSTVKVCVNCYPALTKNAA